MNCKICWAPIKEGQLHCSDCVSRLSQAAFLAQQRPYVSDVSSGRIQVKLVYPVKGRYHIALVGEPAHCRHAFCGEKLGKKWFRKWETFTPGADARKQVCDHCREIFESIEKEVLAAQAS